MATSKKAQTAKKVELKDTFTKVTETAKSVNAQIMETASVVAEDVLETGKTQLNEATKTAKEYINKIDVKEGFNQMKTTAKNLNTNALKMADTVVETTLENSKEWQGVAEKAIKGSLTLVDKQQDIMFDTLESVKGQMMKSANRFKVLFSKN